MPHIAPLSNADASHETREVFDKLQARMGVVLNVWRTLAHAPDVLEATLSLNRAIHKDLPAKLRELAYLKTSLLNGCAY